jgi:hypothetical protein
MSAPRTDTKAWYREPWPWLLMLGPFVVVIAGIYTAWLAITSADGLVEDDYYKKGLAVNQTIARSDKATALGLSVGVRVVADGMTIRLAGRDPSFVAPATLIVTLSHPTRAGLDQTQTFSKNGELYAGKLRLPASGHWLVLVEDEARTWRLMGNVVLPASGETMIGGDAGDSAPAAKRNQ